MRAIKSKIKELGRSANSWRLLQEILEDIVLIVEATINSEKKKK